MNDRFVLARRRGLGAETSVRMKGRGVYFLIGLLLGILVGFGAAQETVRTKTGEFLLQAVRQIDKGVHLVLVKIRNRGDAEGERKSDPAKSVPAPPTPNANSPTENSLYIREFITVLNTAGRPDDAAKGVALVSGNVKNSGTRTPARVDATVFFLGAEGIAHEAMVPIVSQTPLAPGSTQDFLITVENVPTNWVPGRVRVAVTGIVF